MVYNFTKWYTKNFKADKLFDGYHLLNEEHVLITNEKGIVQDIVSVNDAGDDIQQFNGILSPGLINCHCHLELSHLKNVIPPSYRIDRISLFCCNQKRFFSRNNSTGNSKGRKRNV